MRTKSSVISGVFRKTNSEIEKLTSTVSAPRVRRSSDCLALKVSTASSAPVVKTDLQLTGEDAGDAFHLFREKGGAKKLPTNLLLDEHIEEILFIGWILLVGSDEESRRALRTDDFLFLI